MSGSKNTTILYRGSPDRQSQTEAVMRVKCEMYIYMKNCFFFFKTLHTRHWVHTHHHFKFFFYCFSFRGFWATCYSSRWASSLSRKVSRTHAPSWLPTCCWGVFGLPLIGTSPRHGTRTLDGQGPTYPVLQPGQNHLHAPGTCGKEIIDRFSRYLIKYWDRNIG